VGSSNILSHKGWILIWQQLHINISSMLSDAYQNLRHPIQYIFSSRFKSQEEHNEKSADQDP